MVVRAALPTKFAVAEKHMGDLSSFGGEDDIYWCETQKIFVIARMKKAGLSTSHTRRADDYVPLEMAEASSWILQSF
jgi:hypothetical protein